ncbi:tetraacyldisaccharide 4'-kinase [Flavobacteriaceae bacterium S356]|uniref:Tetraacyldisaccharide 4'-kinase n=1 Tax=Asprobacillus argus TaxID=3076534 RepID=A0ABU3LH07_9FLAO|nr:tetraacyldisaccharide 4'-kinase [Flavobacteriaceae bacterium S356]
MKLVRFLLFPFTILYDLITSIRNLLYDKGNFRSTSFTIPIIAVGNLSVGGTGKTPQIEYLIRLLRERSVAVLSRGYKRKTSGFVLLNSNHSSEDVGDEPLQFFRKFPNIAVAVDANRVAGIQRLKKEVNPEIILLDDAYQHRKVKAGFYVLLTKYGELYSDDFILPTGNLRESRRGAKRADLILVTKCPETLGLKEKERIKKKLKPLHGQHVYFTAISYGQVLKGSMPIAVDELSDYTVLLITGIAIPQPLLDFLSTRKIKYQHLKFPDHHQFSPSDIDTIQKKFEAISAPQKIMVTTEKDYVRLSDQIKGLSYIEIETQFLNDSDKFDKEILKFVEV